LPSVATRSARWKPASLSSSIIFATPSSEFRPSAAMLGSAIHFCSRWTASSWWRGIWS
jgi:hypothetical protein